ncbi:polymorphic toxin type 24 domain-containing protein [Rhodococcoides kroppenstedtii]|uniref:polymorphic toxin type 24 domain-containing protein n=1 Tax=Rhodococcoides kroppenstedtii TaxID=293050 RepID=UPI00362EFF14
MTLVCNPLDYADAGSAMGEVARVLGESRSAVLRDLADTGGMAGTDEAGEQFAASYDGVTEAVAVVVARAVRTAQHVGMLVDIAGWNYAMADDPDREASTPPVRESVPVPIELAPSAHGSHEGEPWGWPLVAGAVGYVWPNGDTGRLRGAADSWQMAAAGFETSGFPVSTAIDLIGRQHTPDGPLAVDLCTQLHVLLTDAAANCREVADRCREFADQLDRARVEAQDALEQFLWESALLGTISAAGTVFTAGGAAAGGGAAFAAAVARHGARIAAILRALVESAGLVQRALVAVGERTRQTARAFDALMAGRAAALDELSPWAVLLRTNLAADLRHAERWVGNLPTEHGPPNGYLVRRDASGAVTHYSRYDGDGIALYRVDLVGKTHHSQGVQISTPHVVDVAKNIDPNGVPHGRTLADSVRPALPQEVRAP